jgi:hypothetical protein
MTAWACGVVCVALGVLVVFLPRPTLHGANPLLALLALTMTVISTVGVLTASTALCGQFFKRSRTTLSVTC